MINIYSFFLIISLILTSCNNTDKFENKWYSINSHLKINSDKTFKFERFNSISSSISKGKWEVINDTLILNSFDNNGCFFHENFLILPPNSEKRVIVNKINCYPNQGYVFFKNEKFFIKDSVLIYKSKIKIDNSIFKNIYCFSRKDKYKY